jgi:intraflagellar transport protein 56
MSTSFNYAKELFHHNTVRIIFEYLSLQVVFQNGDNAFQILTQLIDVIPEARLNLIIYYLKQGRF